MTENKSRAKNRPVRKPVGTRRVLSAEQRPGYHRRWVNDIDDRIQMFIEGGYTPVAGDADNSDKRATDPSKLGSSQTRKSVGGGVEAVLMEIPLEWYNEDQAAKQQRNDEIEASYNPKARNTEFSYGNVLKKTKG